MNNRRVTQLLLTAAALSARAVAQSPAGADGDIPSTDVPALKATLYDNAAPAAQREQAAERLLARPDPAARTVLRTALSEAGQPGVQLAAARALGGRPTADASLKGPLLKLLGEPAGADALIDAAGHALTAYKSDSDTLARLLALTAGGDERVRVAAIRAAGTFVDKSVASTLLPLVDPAAQPPRIAAAASYALADLTGLSNSTDPAAWQAWWAANRDKSDQQFQADLAPDRSARADLNRTRLGDMEDAIGRLLAEQYQRTPRDQRPDLLLRFLRDPEPTLRTAACRIARQAAGTDITPQPVKEQLRQLIGDATPAVRRGAAQALALVNDADAVVPLLTQLNQETDSGVRAALADALRPTRDARAVPALLKLLDDPSINTAQTAAESLTEIGDGLRKKDPALADRAAEKIVQVLQTRTTAQNNIDFRAALVQAVAPLQSRPVAVTLVRLVRSQAEDRRVRRALLAAVGHYANPEMTDAIAGWLGDKTDAPTRLAAVKALGESAGSFGEFQNLLAERIDPAKEPVAEIRSAAWKVLSDLFAKATPDELSFWEGKLRDDPIKLLVVLRQQRDRAAGGGDADLAASKNQQIGDACMQTNQFADARDAYLDALNYAKANNKPARVEVISEGLVMAYLRNRQYVDAVNFTQQMIRQDSKFQYNLGPKLKSEAERLVGEAKDYDAALQLIDLSLKMDNPKLARTFAEQMEQTRATVKNRYNQQNQSPFGPGEPFQNAMIGPGRTVVGG